MPEDKSREEERSGRRAWIVVERDGTVSRHASVADYEMKQIEEIVGGDFRQVPISRLPDHRLGVAVRSVAVTEANENHAFTAFMGGIRFAGTVLVGQRRAADRPMFGRQSEGRRYIVPFLNSEAEEVEAALRAVMREGDGK